MLARVIDFETATGDEKNDAVLEFAYTDVDFRRDGYVEHPVAAFVDPGMPISPIARGVHHITDDEIRLRGYVAFDWQRRLLNDNINSPDVFVAHFCDFERRFFDPDGARWICTRKVACRLWPDAPNHKNQTLRYMLGLDDVLGASFTERAMPPHRAGPDTWVTAHIFLKQVQIALDRGHPIERVIDFFVKWTGEPVLLHGPIRFGKHKGKEWTAVPLDYLEWIIFKADEMDEDTKFTAQHHYHERTKGTV